MSDFREKLISRQIIEKSSNVTLYNVKYLRDIRRVRQNTTLYYDVMCHRTDNMFRPFTIHRNKVLCFDAPFLYLLDI